MKSRINKGRRTEGFAVVLAVSCLILTAGCGGGGEGSGGDRAAQQPNQSTPPAAPPPRQFDCSQYSVSVDPGNNLVALTVARNGLPSTASEETLKEWTACVLRSGNIAGRYEHIMFVNDENRQPASAVYSGRSFLVSNFDQGLGIPQFENWSDWGVTGSLRSVMHFPSIESFVVGPKLHELAHAWGAFVLEGDEASGQRGHWAFSSANGQLGGFDRQYLRYLGPVGSCPQAFAASRSPLDPANPFFSAGGYGGDDMPYSLIELYLMGLADASELPATTIVMPGAYYIETGSLQFCAPNGFREYPTREWLQGRYGPRVPDAFNSQFSRNLLVVKVGDLFGSLDPETVRFNELMACEVQDFVKQGPNRLASDFNYWEATLGRGVISTPRADEICLTCARFQDTYPTPQQVEQQCAASFPELY